MKTSKVGRAKASPQTLPILPVESPPCAPKQGETALITAGRKAVAEVFRAFVRNETPEDAMPAVKWLLRLRGFKKGQADCWIFIQYRLFGHAELFVGSDDQQVLFVVEKKFREHMKVLRRKATRRQQLFPVTSIEDENKKSLLFDWLEPQELSEDESDLNAEIAAEMQSIKKAYHYLKRFPKVREQMRAALLK